MLAITGVLLFVPAVIAYFSFWSRYLPDQITTVPVHLQYGYVRYSHLSPEIYVSAGQNTYMYAKSYGANPWAVSSLPQARLKNHQAYDITVSLTLPNSPANLDRGNFMVALRLLGGEDTQTSDRKKTKTQQQIEPPPSSSLPNSPFEVGPEGKSVLPVRHDPKYYLARKKVLATSTRPALVPYQDPLVSLASRIVWLPYYVFINPRKSETTSLHISLMEKVYFGKEIKLPTEVFVEVQAGQNLQVYRASATFAAQLEGLRWFMAYHSWIAFVLFTSFFWVCEMVVLAGTWGTVWVLLRMAGWKLGEDENKAKGKDAVVKAEPDEGLRRRNENEDGLSDTERTFPSIAGQPPLKFEGRIKQEEGEPQGIAPEIHPAAEADDEDDGEEEEGDGPAYRDSGIGTSYDDNVPREGVKRRTSGSRSRQT